MHQIHTFKLLLDEDVLCEVLLSFHVQQNTQLWRARLGAIYDPDSERMVSSIQTDIYGVGTSREDAIQDLKDRIAKIRQQLAGKCVDTITIRI